MHRKTFKSEQAQGNAESSQLHGRDIYDDRSVHALLQIDTRAIHKLKTIRLENAIRWGQHVGHIGYKSAAGLEPLQGQIEEGPARQVAEAAALAEVRTISLLCACPPRPCGLHPRPPVTPTRSDTLDFQGLLAVFTRCSGAKACQGS